ncbi:MAG TPA: VWA domain-containing protein [Vicinamibacteria bacterium]|nr:VWA domain-containing protein [Vicinamibacteria bacterium]
MFPLLLPVSVALALDAQPPRFASDVRMIRLDVSAVDSAGRPVAGLQAADFAVREDGRPVEITFFEAVSTSSAFEPAEAGPSRGLSRRILLLVDAGRMSPGQLIRARQSAARFIAEGTAPGDWVRLLNLSTGRFRDGRIPEDRARLQSAARELKRGADPWRSEDGEVEALVDRFESGPDAMPTEAETTGRFLSTFAQTSGVLGNLESLLVQLQGVSGRKALVLISPGFPQLRNLDRELERVASLARQAATAVYFVDAVGLDGLIPEPGRKWRPVFEMAWERGGGAQDLADATGGFTSRFANSLLPALSRVAAEMHTYYVIGYVPSRPDDGRFRSVDVKVSVPGVRARTKKGYLALASP